MAMVAGAATRTPLVPDAVLGELVLGPDGDPRWRRGGHGRRGDVDRGARVLGGDRGDPGGLGGGRRLLSVSPTADATVPS